MMGGGFGGCTINLLKSEALVPFTQEMKEQYQQGMGINLEVYSASISEGTSIIQKGKAATVII
jgi:galactokinase